MVSGARVATVDNEVAPFALAADFLIDPAIGGQSPSVGYDRVGWSDRGIGKVPAVPDHMREQVERLPRRVSVEPARPFSERNYAVRYSGDLKVSGFVTSGAEAIFRMLAQVCL
jgi:hypothetical protein